MECGASGKIEKSEKIKSSGKWGRAERREKSVFCIREDKENVLEDKKKLFCKRAEKRLPAARVGAKETGAERVSFGRQEGYRFDNMLMPFLRKAFSQKKGGRTQ